MGSLTKKPKAPPPPKPIKPVEMPDPEAMGADKKRKQAELMKRSGRASTVLTDDADNLG